MLGIYVTLLELGAVSVSHHVRECGVKSLERKKPIF